MRARFLTLAIVAMLIAAGCDVFGLAAGNPCAAVAADYSGTVVGTFGTTVGAIRSLAPLPQDPIRWPALAADHPAILCYIDGMIPKAPPPGPNGEIRDPFDRLVIAIVDEEAELIMAGYQDNLPARAP